MLFCLKDYSAHVIIHTHTSSWLDLHKEPVEHVLLKLGQSNCATQSFVQLSNLSQFSSKAQLTSPRIPQYLKTPQVQKYVKLANNTLGNIIADNDISGGGRIFPSACGIWGGQSGDNRIEHNRIRDFYYTGISLGWDWGFADTPAKNNLIANNDISDIGQGSLSDMGGIYVLGKQPGSVISGNRIQNVQARGYGGWGIYLDEGSTGWTVERNLVIGTKTGGFHIHYGRDNVIRRNIFVGAQSDAQLIRVRDDKQGPITFDSNIVVSLDPDVPIVGPAWLKRDVTMKNNIYWSPSQNQPIPFGDDGTGIWLDPKLDRNGIPTNPEVSKRRLQFIDLGQLGPRR
jgi:hypothetical protein